MSRTVKSQPTAEPTLADVLSAIAELLAVMRQPTAAPASGETASPKVTLADIRASGAIRCPKHTDCGKTKNGHFATAKGLAYHVEHSK